ncbi:CehA/McbA family metallohydrolase [Sphingosinicella sp. CPCC 101087]|uniref:CehA/McbA family metallohydrolase n=1 Tax=Sphingosinicella sp. CPCC 101087 TaxID=2497754 RepID=UPI001FB0E730|nr:CehA/McbA family metallohydrolase [Sphingosinicella sp. CPCC 101087]
MRATILLAAAWLAAAIPMAAAGQAPTPAPDLSFTGEIVGADHQTYRPVPFDVPEGVGRITVTLAYDRSNRTVVDMGVWDPARFRGWSGGTRDRFTLAPSDATPGYLAGDLPAGRWRLMLGVPNARSGARAAYEVKVYFDRAGEHRATEAIADPPLKDGPGWYRGDLHLHDAHSDGSCESRSGRRVPCPLFRTVEAAAEAGLDFIAVTDHNTTAHFGGLRELQPYFDDLLLIPGIEITTFGGHANIFGPRRFVDFRVGSDEVADIRVLQRDAAAAGAILSLNHPALPSGEPCMGCGWTWPDTDFGAVAAIEAINGTMTQGPLAGLGFWYARLNEGHRLTGIAASDNHDPDVAPGQAPPGPSPVGRPATVVYARNLSMPAILDAIRAGNVFIDVEGTRSRRLEVEAQAGRDRASMGETLAGRRQVAIHAVVAGAAGAFAELIVNGQPLGQRRSISSDEAQLFLSLEPGQACGWLAINVREADGRPLLVGNPVYLRCD